METYKGQYNCLCPYFIREGKTYIVCSKTAHAEEIERFHFDTQADKTAFRNKTCWFAIPKRCPHYDAHIERIKAGKEERVPPRANIDTHRRELKAKYMRERRKDPNCTW